MQMQCDVHATEHAESQQATTAQPQHAACTDKSPGACNLSKIHDKGRERERKSTYAVLLVAHRQCNRAGGYIDAMHRACNMRSHAEQRRTQVHKAYDACTAGGTKRMVTRIDLTCL